MLNGNGLSDKSTAIILNSLIYNDILLELFMNECCF